MKVSHIEHLGVAVKSLDEAIPYWENVLGLKCYAIEEVADQKVRTACFMLGQTKIELLEPTSEDSTIAKYIENRGVGIHHMALACENIEEQLADAEAKLADGRQQLEDAQVEVDKLEHPKSYVLDRSTNTGYVSFENDSSIVAGVAKVFPLFFLDVAALV